ncbi:colanic acid biosynthesis pyruvyl transferase WcaK [Pseudoalteromonas shioyasakiensis]|uniref:colanic acid biosynthesis pyruvyl transferase WcaK n=1 Tax=Pseudoalteromonas shioyasakiensis TaxID=1190813 RepID=UPI001C3DC5EE|nr:colanic acid biosynthesis pyruvyl transferase WcaK [Pseudoalteromonas shioyasakiensis]
MKLLLVGNHTCGNRGDGAILRGLIAELVKQHPDIKIDIYSRFPISSSFLLGQTLVMDPLDHYHDTQANGLVARVWKKYSRRFLGYFLARKLNKPSSKSLPEHISQQLDVISHYDAVIQVGGSFFVDLYGPAQFEHALCTLLAKKKLFLLGHSVGPFHSKKYTELADRVFSRVDELALRENLSLNYMKQAGISDLKVSEGADTAWVVPNQPVMLPNHLTALTQAAPTIAITLRELAPFDKRLGVTQKQYEEHFAQLIDNLINDGYKIVLCSTCTGIGGYHRDDRMTALKVQSLVRNKSSCHVIMDELNDVELGSFLGLCTLTIGTRLHSAIISMNFGTPAIALNYEHKSKGIMAQLDLPELSKDVTSLFSDELLTSVRHLLANLDDAESKMAQQVEVERQKVRDMVTRVLQKIERD